MSAKAQRASSWKTYQEGEEAAATPSRQAVDDDGWTLQACDEKISRQYTNLDKALGLTGSDHSARANGEAVQQAEVLMRSCVGLAPSSSRAGLEDS